MCLIEELAKELDVEPYFLERELTKIVPRRKTLDDECPTCGAWLGEKFNDGICYRCNQRIGSYVL